MTTEYRQGDSETVILRKILDKMNHLVSVPGAATAWGDITGSLADQEDLQAALDSVGGGGLAYVDDARIIVQRTGVPLADGALLRAAVIAAAELTPSGSPTSRTNLATVILPPGNYDVSKDPATWFSSHGVPNNAVGVEGDKNLDIDSADYYTKTGGVWVFQLNFGGTWLAGTGVPGAGLGVPDDSYVRTPSGERYVKVAAAWTDLGNLGVSPNPTLGPVVPSNGSGSDGDQFIRTTNGHLYTKVSGVWTEQYPVVEGIWTFGAGPPDGGDVVANVAAYLDTDAQEIYTYSAEHWELTVPAETGITGLGVPDFVSIVSLASDPKSVLITSVSTGSSTVFSLGSQSCNRFFGLTFENTDGGYALDINPSADPFSNPYSDTYFEDCIISKQGGSTDQVRDGTATFVNCDMGTGAFNGVTFSGYCRDCQFTGPSLSKFYGILEDCMFSLENSWAPDEFSGIVRRSGFGPSEADQNAITLPQGASGEFDRCQFYPSGTGLAVGVAEDGEAATRFLFCDYSGADIASGISSSFTLEDTPIGETRPRDGTFQNLVSTGGYNLRTGSVRRLRVNVSGVAANEYLEHILNVRAVLDFSSIDQDGTAEDLTVSVPNAKVGDTVALGLPATPQAGIVFSAFVSAPNVVTVRAMNLTPSIIDPDSAEYQITVFQFQHAS